MDMLPGQIHTIADAIDRHGWYTADDLLDPGLVGALADECLDMDTHAQLQPAHVGRGSKRRLAAALRGDRTRWLDESFSKVQADYLTHMLALRDALNRRLFLGLHTFEAHYAVYPPGAHYDRHRDRFRDDDARVLSTVLYLNRNWRPEHEGALRLHLPDGSQHNILPVSGRMALFLSADIEHEVLAPRRERMSLAGWFRRNGPPFF